MTRNPSEALSFQFSHTKLSFGHNFLVYLPHITKVTRQLRRLRLELATKNVCLRVLIR